MSNEFEIRADVPMRPGRTGLRIEYPFEQLQVGQCIVVAAARRCTIANRAKRFMQSHPGWILQGGILEKDKTHAFWCVARPDDAGAPVAATVRAQIAAPIQPTRRPVSDVLPVDSPMAKRLREAAKLQPTGKRAAHIAK